MCGDWMEADGLTCTLLFRLYYGVTWQFKAIYRGGWGIGLVGGMLKSKFC